MFDLIGGIPLHPLVVHAVEVLVPVAALVLLLAAVWPRFRRWAYVLPVLLALGAVVLVPVATQSGEALQRRVGETPLVEEHINIAEGLLPWVLGLLVVSAGVVWWTWTERRTVASAGPGATATVRALPSWLPIVLIVASVVVSAGTVYEAIRIGHSGATAVWSGVANMPVQGDG
jgi:hypothetical protein